MTVKMTDNSLVYRLRNAEAPRDGSSLLCDLADEAANEIERLWAEVKEIKFLKSDRDRWINIASALYNDLLEGSEYNFESSRIYEESIKNY